MIQARTTERPTVGARSALATAAAVVVTLSLIAGTRAEAQSAATRPRYVARMSTQPFVPLTAGTPILQPPSYDGSKVIPIGFSFRFYGESFDFIEVSENGLVTFARTCAVGCAPDTEMCNNAGVCERSWTSAEGEAFPNPSSPNRVAAPFWDELMLEASGGPNASLVHSRVLGVAPNRELVVEWKNVHHSVDFSSSVSRTSFQLRLKETTNTIRFHYGPFTRGPDNNAWSGRIGIENHTGDSGLAGVPCAASPGGCGWSDLVTLAHRVIEISVPDAPELTGSIAPTLGAEPGASASVRVTVENMGLMPTGVPFDVAVYLSIDSSISPSEDVLIGTAHVRALAPGETATASVAAQLPRDIAPGYYVLGAIIDSGQAVREATRDNNTVTAEEPFLVGADLSLLFDAETRPIGPGGTGRVTFSVTNRSSTRNAVPWRMYLSADSMFDAGDRVVAEGSETFPASATTEVQAQVTIPADAEPAYYTLIGVVDPDNQIAEADELNNESYTFVVVGPDLYPASLSVPPESGRGAELTFTLHAMNAGSTTARAPYAIYLSSDETFDAADTLLASGRFTARGAEDTTIEATVRVPTTLAPGTYHCIVVLDGANTIREIDEGNNISTMPSTIRLVGPDLSAEMVNGAAVAFRGQPYDVDVVIKNLGGEPVSGVYFALHLSDNQLVTTTDPLLAEVGPFDLREKGEMRLRQTVAIPGDTQPGKYWVGLIADSTSVVMEDVEQNNQRRSPETITVRDIAPDFAVSDVFVPSLAGAGESFPVQRALENRGNDAGETTYALFLVSTASGQRVGPVGGGRVMLPPRGLSSGVDRVLVPGDLTPGLYAVEYVMDPDGLVAELFEDNNVARSRDAVEIDPADLEIVTTTLPVATVGLGYSAAITVRGAHEHLSFSILSGALPPGLSLDPATGRIGGTPSEEGLRSFTVRVEDGTLSSAKPLTLTVASPTTALEVATRWLPAAWAGQLYQFPLTAVGGVPPYRWEITPALPAGFTVTSSGAIEGRAAQTIDSRVYALRVTDAKETTSETMVTFRVLDRRAAVVFTPSAMADGMVDTPYAQALAAERGRAPYAFSLVDGELPPGLRLGGEPSTGFEITGTPTRAGSYAFTLQVTDARGDIDQSVFVISIEASNSVAFVTKSLPPGRLSQPYKDVEGRAVTLKAVVFRGENTVRYSLVSGALPEGLTLEASGELVGMPTEAGVFSFVARAYDEALNTEDLRAFGIMVEGQKEMLMAHEGGCTCVEASKRARSPLGMLLGWSLALGLFIRPATRRSTARALALFWTALAGHAAYAQATPAGSARAYRLSEDNQPYVSRTQGTALTFASNDDDSAEYALPFRFHFFDRDYETLKIGTNAFVSFTDSASAPGNTSVPSTTTPNAIIAAFWDDLLAGSVAVSIEGVTPNRIAIIQWSDMRHYPGNGTERFDVQLWLYEGPAARFEIHFGPGSNLSSARMDATIGFEDATGGVGYGFSSCSPGCSASDLSGFEGHVFRAMQDAGEDIYAIGVGIETTDEPVRVYQSIPFEVVTTLGSYHESAIGPFAYSVLLTGPGTSTAAVPLFTSRPMSLEPYETRVTRDAISIPLTTRPGRYHLVLVADPENAIREPSEDNNRVIGAQTLLVGERGPDLRVASVVASAASLTPGARIDVTLSLENAGNLDAHAAWRVVLSRNRAPSPEDITLAASLEDAHLPIGARSNLTVPVTIPPDLAAGRYRLGAIVDPANLVPELSEVNNAATSKGTIVLGRPGLEVVSAELPIGYVGVDYDAGLIASGGDGEYEWALEAGTLPSGLSVSEGALRGRPTEATTASLTFRVTSGGASASRTLKLEILPDRGPLTIVTRELMTGFIGAAYPPVGEGQRGVTDRLIAVGGAGPATFALTSGAPRGLALDPDGLLHGVPEEKGFFLVVVSATDGVSTVSRTIPLTIAEPGRLTLLVGAVPHAQLEEPYAYELFVVGQDPSAVLEFRVLSGSLPPGLDLSPSGLLSGTPTHAGTYALAIEAFETTPNGARDSANLLLVVDAPTDLSITPSSIPEAMVGEALVVTFEARQGKGPYVWSYDLYGAVLPQGLAFETIEVGGERKLRLHGTPTTPTTEGGLFTFKVMLDDAGGRHTERAIAFRVVEAPRAEKNDGGCACLEPRERSGAWALFSIGLLAVGLLTRRFRPR